jgi:hypothetical protein
MENLCQPQSTAHPSPFPSKDVTPNLEDTETNPLEELLQDSLKT